MFQERRMSLVNLLSTVYPDQFIKPKSLNKKTQNIIKAMLKSLFPGQGNWVAYVCLLVEVLEEYRHPDIVTPSGAPLELDFFYPQLKVAVEYQVILVASIVTFKGTTALCECKYVPYNFSQ